MFTTEKDETMTIFSKRMVQLSQLVDCDNCDFSIKFKQPKSNKSKIKLLAKYYSTEGTAILVEKEKVYCYIHLKNIKGFYKYDGAQSDISERLIDTEELKYLKVILKYHFDQAFDLAKIKNLTENNFYPHKMSSNNMSFLDYINKNFERNINNP